MKRDEERTSLAGPLGSRMSRTVQRLVDRGRAEIDKAAKAGRAQLERRQVLHDLDHFWVRLGKTAYRLAEAGEIEHPALTRAIAHIRELETQLERLKRGEEGGPASDGTEDDPSG